MYYSAVYFNTLSYFFPCEMLLQRRWFLYDLHWKLPTGQKSGSWPNVNQLKCFPDYFSNSVGTQVYKNTTSLHLTSRAGKEMKWREVAAVAGGRGGGRCSLRFSSLCSQSSVRPLPDSEFAYLTWKIHLFVCFNLFEFWYLETLLYWFKWWTHFLRSLEIKMKT